MTRLIWLLLFGWSWPLAIVGALLPASVLTWVLLVLNGVEARIAVGIVVVTWFLLRVAPDIDRAVWGDSRGRDG